MPPALQTIILDFEGVVFETRLKAMYAEIFAENDRPKGQLDFFLGEIFKEEYRSKNCRDKTLSDMIDPLMRQYPDWAPELEAFKADRQFHRYIGGVLPGMDLLMRRIAADKNFALYGLSNWPADGYEVLKKVHPATLALFRDVVISGQLGCKKPDPEIFIHTQKLMGDPDPKTVYFFDDKKRNVEAAAATVGWNGIPFTGPEALEREISTSIRLPKNR